MDPRRDEFKKQAAEAAVEFIQSGMVVGLGHGSTVHYALDALQAKLKSGALKEIIGIPCSIQTEAEATRLGISLGDLNAVGSIDITIDGADEVDPQLNLIKGAGGALLREKIVAQACRREIIVVDEGKLSDQLGEKCPLPIEVMPFGWKHQVTFLQGLGGKAKLRLEDHDQPALSDQGNYLLDCHFGPIADPATLARELESRSGIIAHGLFLGLASDVIVAGPSGLQHKVVARP
jgi:ribose 5-phosphate isomerase A